MQAVERLAGAILGRPMVVTLSDLLRRASTGRMALLALLIFASFTAIILPRQAARSEQETGSSASPDTSFLYSRVELYQMAESYGDEGRQSYVRARFTFDLVWPLVYTLFLVTSISWLSGRAFTPDSPWQRANLVPVLAALFDYLENLATSLVMLRFPDQTPVVDLLAPVFTLLKWSLLTASFALLLLGIVIAMVRWISRRRQSAPGEGP